MQGAWRFQERRLRKSAAIVLATAIAPVAAAEAQGIAIERIEAIERQIGGLQSELRRLKSELGEAKQQLRQSRSEAQSAQEELKRSRDQLRASQEGTLRAREAAQRVQEQTKTAHQPPPVAPSPAPIITTSDGSIQVGGVRMRREDRARRIGSCPRAADVRREDFIGPMPPPDVPDFIRTGV